MIESNVGVRAKIAARYRGGRHRFFDVRFGSKADILSPGTIWSHSPNGGYGIKCSALASKQKNLSGPRKPVEIVLKMRQELASLLKAEFEIEKVIVNLETAQQRVRYKSAVFNGLQQLTPGSAPDGRP